MDFSRVHHVSTLFTAHSAEEAFPQRCFKTQTRLFVCFIRCRRGRPVPRVQRRRRPSRAGGRLRLADVPATVRDQYSDVSVLGRARLQAGICSRPNVCYILTLLNLFEVVYWPKPEIAGNRISNPRAAAPRPSWEKKCVWKRMNE